MLSSGLAEDQLHACGDVAFDFAVSSSTIWSAACCSTLMRRQLAIHNRNLQADIMLCSNATATTAEIPGYMQCVWPQVAVTTVIHYEENRLYKLGLVERSMPCDGLAS